MVGKCNLVGKDEQGHSIYHGCVLMNESWKGGYPEGITEDSLENIPVKDIMDQLERVLDHFKSLVIGTGRRSKIANEEYTGRYSRGQRKESIIEWEEIVQLARKYPNSTITWV